MAAISRKAGAWVQEMRLPFLVVSVLPAAFGAVIARWTHVGLNLPHLAAAVAAAVSVHIGANVINDYFDHRNGTDGVNREFVHGFTGGSRVIQAGLLTYHEVFWGAVVFLAAGLASILYLGASTGHPLLFMGAAALLAAVTYSLFLHSLVVGELIVGACFGTLIPAGSFFAQAGFVSASVLTASVPMGLLVFLILFMNEFPDYRADRASGKRTLVVRLGRERAAGVYAGVLALVYAYTGVLAAAFGMPLLLLSFLTVPLAFVSARRLMRHHDEPAELRPSIIATIVLFTANSLVLIAAFALRGAA